MTVTGSLLVRLAVAATADWQLALLLVTRCGTGQETINIFTMVSENFPAFNGDTFIRGFIGAGPPGALHCMLRHVTQSLCCRRVHQRARPLLSRRGWVNPSC